MDLRHLKSAVGHWAGSSAALTLCNFVGVAGIAPIQGTFEELPFSFFHCYFLKCFCKPQQSRNKTNPSTQWEIGEHRVPAVAVEAGTHQHCPPHHRHSQTLKVTIYPHFSAGSSLQSDQTLRANTDAQTHKPSLKINATKCQTERDLNKSSESSISKASKEQPGVQVVQSAHG